MQSQAQQKAAISFKARNPRKAFRQKLIHAGNHIRRADARAQNTREKSGFFDGRITTDGHSQGFDPHRARAEPLVRQLSRQGHRWLATFGTDNR